MFSRISWKFAITAVVIAWALFSLYPFEDRKFDDYLRATATADKSDFSQLIDEANQRVSSGKNRSLFVALKQIASERQIDLAKFFPDLPMTSLKNIEKRNDVLLNELLKRSKAALKFGLDLKGGVAFTLEAPAPDSTNPDEHREKLSKAIEIIDNRINSFGVAEPVIRAIGENRIEVQLPGISTKDNPEVVDAVKKPALLDFRLVHPQMSGMATRPTADAVPPGYTILAQDSEDDNGRPFTLYHAVKRIPDMTGENVDRAFATPDIYGRYEIHLTFNSKGAEQFASLTEKNVGRNLGVVLDGKLYSAPRINERIGGGNCQITGDFTQREAIELANVLNNPLDVELKIKEQYEVGPTLAADAITSGKNAFMFGTALTVVFILIFYTFGGVIAAIGMLANVIVILGVMAMPGIDATLTMPGIAGIVLTLAMSVDSNILIFERMREELRTGKTLVASLEAGFEKAWSAILDSNVTTLFTAVAMIIFGNGPVKGFGVTLTIGIFTTMFAALIVSKLLLQALILPGIMKRMPMFSVLQDTKFDFLKYAKPSFIFSWSIVLIGVAVVAYKGKEIYGIDFTGGDMITMRFEKRVDEGQLRATAEKAGYTEASFSYQQLIGSDKEVLRATVGFDHGAPLLQALQKDFPQAGFTSEGQTRIGPSVGESIQWSALLSLIVALGLILIYVAFRFEIGYGVGAVIATIHDLVMTIGIFVLFGGQFNAPMVAAILLIAGYSINDTIVVFDRIREELKLNPLMNLKDVINHSLNLTISRTIITGGTTLLTAVTLILVTKGDVHDIAFTLLIGVVTGTFSSLFIASPIFFWWHKGDRKHIEDHKDIAPKYSWEAGAKTAE